MTYYCIKCENVIGILLNNKYDYLAFKYCIVTPSKDYPTIMFLDCKKCEKFVGIICFNVCENCFGKNLIFEEKILKNWFFEYKKKSNTIINYCKICNKNKFRWQHWFFKELSFFIKD